MTDTLTLEAEKEQRAAERAQEITEMLWEKDPEFALILDIVEAELS